LDGAATPETEGDGPPESRRSVRRASRSLDGARVSASAAERDGTACPRREGRAAPERGSGAASLGPRCKRSGRKPTRRHWPYYFTSWRKPSWHAVAAAS